MMNKKQAIAYAKVTLDYMQSSKYRGEITPDNLAIEMRQTFKLYNNSIIEEIANAQSFARKKLENIKKQKNDYYMKK